MCPVHAPLPYTGSLWWKGGFSSSLLLLGCFGFSCKRGFTFEESWFLGLTGFVWRGSILGNDDVFDTTYGPSGCFYFLVVYSCCKYRSRNTSSCLLDYYKHHHDSLNNLLKILITHFIQREVGVFSQVSV